jgi:hypothetical protein
VLVEAGAVAGAVAVHAVAVATTGGDAADYHAVPPVVVYAACVHVDRCIVYIAHCIVYRYVLLIVYLRVYKRAAYECIDSNGT